MYKYRSVHNDELLEKMQFSLKRRSDRLQPVNDFLERVDELGGKHNDALTIGTDENNRTIAGSVFIPAAPFAIGVVAATIGLIAMVPQLGADANALSEAEMNFMNQARTTGESLLSFSVNTMGLSFKLAAIPATVAALSIPKKIARVLSQKTYSTLTEEKNIVQLIDDIVNDVEDPSIEFPKKFLYRVDLSENSNSFNKELLGCLAYYRYCFQKEQNGENKNDELNASFTDIIHFLDNSKYRLTGVSKKFKENKFVNELLNEFMSKEELQKEEQSIGPRK